ncbi:hypothetical protein CPHO_02180 [Corynebacterium phocae]|uniref:PTS EIIA type-1 domain-containing protein n=1 Tax=Corynebacterium phocae TaxID=161895 RepID=A0A1L7D1L3_9CORY|nr:glucose PTS transporter subunit IIA [Corynebacterium phocae]APT91912.1 hypothetical protein CPHO_02180 [Corynebacterium phocae]
MFGFDKKKVELVAPCAGQSVALEQINDPVFSQKMLGDGVAIVPEAADELIIAAPATGTVKQLFKSLHAFVICTEEGLDILVHIGMDTVALKGEGFTALAAKGDKVTAGTGIVKVNAAHLRSKDVDLTTPIVMSEKKQVASVDVARPGPVRAGAKLAVVTLA